MPGHYRYQGEEWQYVEEAAKLEKTIDLLWLCYCQRNATFMKRTKLLTDHIIGILIVYFSWAITMPFNMQTHHY